MSIWKVNVDNLDKLFVVGSNSVYGKRAAGKSVGAPK
jgi:hypothetical protein